jgi:uncharacterized surface protein with fasciclin (FAS1) repeats
MPATDTRLARARRVAGWPVIALALAATAACASTTSSTASAAPAASSHPMASPSHSMTETTATIGMDCGMIPAAGMGSMHGMSMDPFVIAASHNPLITTLAAEIRKAGLTATLDSARDITVFAPDNQAFAHDMTMIGGMADLTRTLKYLVVSGHITPAELASGMTLTTLEGGTLKTARMGATYEVNNAAVTCGNLHTANATVYVIDAVLMPAR